MTRQLFLAAALTCALCLSVTAGEIPTSGAPNPQPQQVPSPTIVGDIPSDGVQWLSDAAISALLTALGLASI